MITNKKVLDTFRFLLHRNIRTDNFTHSKKTKMTYMFNKFGNKKIPKRINESGLLYLN